MTKRWIWAQKLELAWWKHYLRSKPIDEYLAWKKNYWHHVFDLLKPQLCLYPTTKILDAGCGPAGVFIAVDTRYITAIDPLIDSYNDTLLHFKKTMYPHVRFSSKTLEDFNESNSYDVVFCMNAINHVKNIKQAMQNTINAAKPGGIIIIGIDAHNFKWAKFLFRLLPGDVLHPHQYDLKEYVNMIKQCGCTIEKRMFHKKEFWFNHYFILAKKL